MKKTCTFFVSFVIGLSPAFASAKTFYKAAKCSRLLSDFISEDKQVYMLDAFHQAKSSVNKLSFMELNSLNLVETIKIVSIDKNGQQMTVVKQEKPKHQKEGLARNIQARNPDIITLIEVDTLKALSDFNSEYLNSEYKPLLIEGNDERGIDVAVLVRKSLPLKIEMRTTRDLRFENEYVFSRDLPVLVFKENVAQKDGSNAEQVKFALLGTHMKSMRSSDTDAFGLKKRTLQAEATAHVISELKTELGVDTPIFLNGDFNNHLPSSPEFTAIHSVPMKDVLDLFPAKDRFTHFYFNKQGKPDFHQLDGFLISPSNKIKVTSAEIVENIGENGQPLPHPRTFNEREQLPSDHLPTLVNIEFKN